MVVLPFRIIDQKNRPVALLVKKGFGRTEKLSGVPALTRKISRETFRITLAKGTRTMTATLAANTQNFGLKTTPSEGVSNL